MTDLQRLLKRFAIHEAQHQHFAAGGILHDGRKQPLHLVEIDLLRHPILIHAFSDLSPEKKSPLSRMASAG